LEEGRNPKIAKAMAIMSELELSVVLLHQQLMLLLLHLSCCFTAEAAMPSSGSSCSRISVAACSGTVAEEVCSTNYYVCIKKICL
jgi:hypothetical protein